MPQATQAPSGINVDQLVTQAKELYREYVSVQNKIDSNRKLLRLLDSNGMLTEDQGEWLDSFFPVKAKGSNRSDEEIKRSREVKKEALNGTAS